MFDISSIGVQVLGVAFPILTILICVLVIYLITYISKTTTSKKLKEALGILEDLIISVVGSLNQTVAEDLKARTTSGKLTITEKTELKVKARAEIKKQLEPSIKQILESRAGNFDRFLSHKIESEVGRQKKAKRICSIRDEHS